MVNDGVIGCLTDESEAKRFCDKGNELNNFVTPFVYYHIKSVTLNEIPKYLATKPLYHKFELERAIRNNEKDPTVTFQDELNRAKLALARKLYNPDRDLCPKCEGKGRLANGRKCPKCLGGFVPLVETNGDKK